MLILCLGEKIIGVPVAPRASRPTFAPCSATYTDGFRGAIDQPDSRRMSSSVLPQTHVFISYRLFEFPPTQEPVQSTAIARRIKFMSVDACASHSRLKLWLIISVIQAVQSRPFQTVINTRIVSKCVSFVVLLKFVPCTI